MDVTYAGERPQQFRVIQNLDRVLDGAIEVAFNGGWADLTIAAVSRASGLSTRAIHNRFADRSAMAAAAFRTRCAPALLESLTEVLNAAGLLEAENPPPPLPVDPSQQSANPYTRAVFRRSLSADPWIKIADAVRATANNEVVWPSETSTPNPRREPPSETERRKLAVLALQTSVRSLLASVEATSIAAAELHLEGLRATGPSDEWLSIALDSFNRPTPSIQAAVELLIVSQFDQAMSDAVTEQISIRVAQWCTPARKGPSPELAAKRAYLICLALGLVLGHKRNDARDLDLGEEVQKIYDALQSERKPVALPKASASYLSADISFDTGEVALDALLNGTLNEIGVRGFEGVTTHDIARAAGYSEGLIFARYPSKLALFLDASKRQQAISYRNFDAYQAQVAKEHGMGIADAVAIREVQRPTVRLQRATHLEQIRISWHNVPLQNALAEEMKLFIADATATDPNWAPANSPASLHFSVSLGLGIALLPVLCPGVWGLPYDIVTIPYTQS